MFIIYLVLTFIALSLASWQSRSTVYSCIYVIHMYDCHMLGNIFNNIAINIHSLYWVLRAKSPKHCTPPTQVLDRYVDDTFVIHKEANKQSFLQHINGVDPTINLQCKEDGSIPFLDTIVKPEVDGSLSITVYRKPTHTDQYLQWDSHHNLSAKFSVINTLSHRAQNSVQQSWAVQTRKRTSQEGSH